MAIESPEALKPLVNYDRCAVWSVDKQSVFMRRSGSQAYSDTAAITLGYRLCIFINCKSSTQHHQVLVILDFF